jgi:hypothetical protein
MAATFGAGGSSLPLGLSIPSAVLRADGGSPTIAGMEVRRTIFDNQFIEG